MRTANRSEEKEEPQGSLRPFGVGTSHKNPPHLTILGFFPDDKCCIEMLKTEN